MEEIEYQLFHRETALEHPFAVLVVVVDICRLGCV